LCADGFGVVPVFLVLGFFASANTVPTPAAIFWEDLVPRG